MPPSRSLAMLGGEAEVPRAISSSVRWPEVSDEDRAAIDRVLSSGRLTANSMGEPEVRGLEREWAEFVGVKHCAAVSNGTAAISLALAAAGVRPGDEVLAPALSFIATAVAPLDGLALPVFVDIDPVSFNMDVSAIERAITPRTRAILVVHLHGLPADMDEILAIARKHDLVVVEDAAQSHGATYRGRRTGSIGDINAFSINVTKNLPTCGEGGLITTDDSELFECAVMKRQFGEVITDDAERSYISHVLGFNEKINPVQAAFARSQLTRLERYDELRKANVERLLGRLGELPGIRVPTAPPDRTHAWHILRLRFDPAAAGVDGVGAGQFRKVLHRCLRAEGVPLSQYQLAPLPAQRVFQDRDGYGRGYPWTIAGDDAPSYRLEDYPETMRVIEDSLTLQKRHVNPFTGDLLERYADAFEKVWENLDMLARIASSLPYEPPWAKTTDSVVSSS